MTVPFWKPLLAVLMVLASMLWIRHYGAERYRAGYQQATSEDAAALAKQIHDAAIQEIEDAERLQRATHDLETTRSDLAALRAQPVHHVVCHAAANSRSLPEAPGLPDVVVAGSGPLPAEAEGSFDPTAELIALADEADDILAACRYLHQSVHGVPSIQPARVPQ